MKFIYTKHVEEKLHRPDVRGFGISKVQIESIIKSPRGGVITLLRSDVFSPRRLKNGT